MPVVILSIRGNVQRYSSPLHARSPFIREHSPPTALTNPRSKSLTEISLECLCWQAEREYAHLWCPHGGFERYSSPSPDFLAQGNDSGMAQRQHAAGVACGQFFPGRALYPHRPAPAAWHFYPIVARSADRPDSRTCHGAVERTPKRYGCEVSCNGTG